MGTDNMAALQAGLLLEMELESGEGKHPSLC